MKNKAFLVWMLGYAALSIVAQFSMVYECTQMRGLKLPMGELAIGQLIDFIFYIIVGVSLYEKTDNR